MATKSANTFKKKEREEAKRRKKIAKEAKKSERKEIKAGVKTERNDDFDPDIAGIVPGPQPREHDE
ncbi:MAG TPA: hypothetical protein PKM41_09225 [Deltaproteobacteria bacterium]|jgi:hypothetical protein|nr:hypothetical protein [Deltaproteobacteria bacterium]HOI06273.1 hypothetical protein [Deltaproteobacteria bacterium]